MLLFPAIDIKNGRAIRLIQGKKENVTDYADPVEIAKKFQSEGATHMHIVNIDGAFSNENKNLELIRSIRDETTAYMQLGGGMRTLYDVDFALQDIGVDRVVLGTIALENRELTTEIIKKYNKKIALGIDAYRGEIMLRGWTKATGENALDFVNEISGEVSTIIYTDIEKDGMLSSPNYEELKKMQGIKGVNIIASGGVGSLKDIELLKKQNTYAVIVGKAIYEKKFTLIEALEECK